MLRLAGRSEEDDAELELLLSAALKPLMENRELRRLLAAASGEDKLSWLRSAEELGITLLSGAEDTGDSSLYQPESASAGQGVHDAGSEAMNGQNAVEYGHTGYSSRAGGQIGGVADED
ncbi:hypothetical protein D3C73_1310820 [compost metagenome]